MPPASPIPSVVPKMGPLAITPRSAYVHVPFCVHRCGYCDFTVVAGKDHLIPAYLAALATEFESLGKSWEVETLFIGGGTPTHLPPADLDRLLQLVQGRFPLAEGAEFSVEANPGDLSVETIDSLVRAGVNRVSLGVQSFDDSLLTFLERDHRRHDIERWVRHLRPRIPNLSLDLIFGVPGQSLERWRETLRIALDLEPVHLSTYGLTFEKGTRFWTRRSKGEIIPAAEELEREMYAAAMDDLAAAGFEQYEISSFALPGFRCRHNQVYWSGRPYFGCGPGAASYLDGTRRSNHRSMTAWLQRLSTGRSPVADSETLSPEDRARESIVLGLRRIEGIRRAPFREQTGIDLNELAGSAIARNIARGWLEDFGDGIRLTREGRFVADGVIVDFL